MVAGAAWTVAQPTPPSPRCARGSGKEAGKRRSPSCPFPCAYRALLAHRAREKRRVARYEMSCRQGPESERSFMATMISIGSANRRYRHRRRVEPRKKPQPRPGLLRVAQLVGAPQSRSISSSASTRGGVDSALALKVPVAPANRFSPPVTAPSPNTVKTVPSVQK